METEFTQKLPNANTVLILGIVSLVICCYWGSGFITAIIGLVLANKDRKLYLSNPDRYTKYETLNTGKILCIIGLVLGITNLLISIYFKMFVDENQLQQMLLDFQTKMQQQG